MVPLPFTGAKAIGLQPTAIAKGLAVGFYAEYGYSCPWISSSVMAVDWHMSLWLRKLSLALANAMKVLKKIIG